MSERYILEAYEKGFRTARRDGTKRECPYLPSTQREKWEAWLVGFAEGDEAYTRNG